MLNTDVQQIVDQHVGHFIQQFLCGKQLAVSNCLPTSAGTKCSERPQQTVEKF